MWVSYARVCAHKIVVGPVNWLSHYPGISVSQWMTLINVISKIEVIFRNWAIAIKKKYGLIVCITFILKMASLPLLTSRQPSCVCVFVHAHWGFPRLTKTAYPFRCQLFPLLPFIAHMLSAWSSRCYRIFRRRAAATTLSLGGWARFKPTSTRLWWPYHVLKLFSVQ